MRKMILVFAVATVSLFADEYTVLATSKTSTMEKEMNEAAGRGYRFSAVMGGETAFGGKEVVVVMGKSAGGGGTASYKLLATSKTSTLQKEMEQMAKEGFVYRGQTVFESAFGGREVSVIMERAGGVDSAKRYRLLATSKTSTLEKELAAAGQEGYKVVGMTVSKTAFGGAELVAICEK
jgi:hypothetical protein